MNRYRLEKIRDHLRNNVSDDRFDLDTWAGNQENPWYGETNLACGSVGCIMGHAATIPEFQSLGLSLVKVGSWAATLAFKEWRGMQAAAHFLDMSMEDAEHLFYASSYPARSNTSRQEVIDRINDYLMNN